MKCARCGFEISNPSSAFCTLCGTPISSSTNAVSPAPMMPVAPANPAAPMTSAAPIAPADPAAPMTSAAPIAPADPAAPMTSAAPIAPVDPAVPMTSAAPIAPVDPAAPMTSVPDFSPTAPVFNPAPDNYSMPTVYAGTDPQSYPAEATTGFYPGGAPMPSAPVALPCGQCGFPIQVGSPICTNCGLPAPPPQFAIPPKKKKSKGARAAIISVVSLVVLIAGLFAGYFILRSSNYEDAVMAMNNGEYQKAQEAFESWILANYKDSAANAEFCRQTLLYDQATEALDREDYATAADLFGQIPGFEDADSKKAYCLIFEEAIGYYNAGQYWKAYDLFKTLNSAEADVWRNKCIQPSPSQGVVEQGPGYTTSGIRLTIDSWSSKNIYFSIYTVNGDYWGSVYVKGWSEYTVSVPAGTYYFNVAFGSDWFGEKDMFGQGSGASYYDHFELGGKTEHKIQSGYRYTVQLG